MEPAAVLICNCKDFARRGLPALRGDEMTNRERALATLGHRQPDRTPYSVEFTVPAHEAMVRYSGDPDFEAGLDNCFTRLSTETDTCWREVEPGIWEDEWGVRWNRTVDKDIGTPCNLVVTPANVDTFAVPDPDDATRWAAYPETIAANPDGFFVARIGFSLFERAWTLSGMEDLLAAMVLDKPFAHRLLDRILEFNLGIIERACSYPVDVMSFGDDWGQQHGLLMGYRLWCEFIRPRIEQMYVLAKRHGKYVRIHSCGKVDELFPDLIERGVDIFNPFQPEVIDVFEAKRKYGRDLSFHGGISTQRTLPYGTPQQVRDEVRRLMDEVGKEGGLIAAPAHAIPGDAKPENMAAMFEVLNEG
jgi:uroporphyrinogen decarboxylase